MIKSGKGGGNTRTGLVFEGKTDLATFLNLEPHYSVMGSEVFFNGYKVAEIYKKHAFYNVFLNNRNRLVAVYIKTAFTGRQYFRFK